MKKYTLLSIICNITNASIPTIDNILVSYYLEDIIQGYEISKDIVFIIKKYKITSFNGYPYLNNINGINTSIRFLENVDKNT